MNWNIKISALVSCPCLVAFLIVALLPSELRSGTIIALQFVGNRIIIAADSRETLKDTSSFDDDACKITPLDKQMFFAGTGIQSSG
jgi:hypothetical protein